MSLIGIITVVTNEKNNLNEYFNSLIKQTLKDFTIYFVDNNSQDGSLEYFKSLNKLNLLDVKYIQIGFNSGFSSGCNIGAEIAIKDGCKYLFFTNNDLYFDEKVLEELTNLIECNESVICTGPILFKHRNKSPNEIQEFGGKINFRLGKLTKFFTNQNVNNININEIIETDFIGGGTCFIKADVFKNIGMFEINYFAYFDEIDLAYRIKVLNNYKMYVTSKAKIWHNHNWTKTNKQGYYFEYYLIQRNKYLYFKKYKFYSSILVSLFEDIIKFPWRAVWFIKVCDIKLPLYYIRGTIDGLLNKKGKPNLKFIK